MWDTTARRHERSQFGMAKNGGLEHLMEAQKASQNGYEIFAIRRAREEIETTFETLVFRPGGASKRLENRCGPCIIQFSALRNNSAEAAREYASAQWNQPAAQLLEIRFT
jgi:hypothetical protein